MGLFSANLQSEIYRIHQGFTFINRLQWTAVLFLQTLSHWLRVHTLRVWLHPIKYIHFEFWFLLKLLFFLRHIKIKTVSSLLVYFKYRSIQLSITRKKKSGNEKSAQSYQNYFWKFKIAHTKFLLIFLGRFYFCKIYKWAHPKTLNCFSESSVPNNQSSFWSWKNNYETLLIFEDKIGFGMSSSLIWESFCMGISLSFYKQLMHL